MKILLVQPTADKYGHFGIYIAKLAKHIAEEGSYPVIFTNKLDVGKYIRNDFPHQVVETRGGSLEFEPYERIYNSNQRKYWFGYFKNSFVILKDALDYSKGKNFDGIYISDVEFTIASVLLLSSRNLPPVVMQVNASNFSYAEYPGSQLKKLYKALQTRIFQIALRHRIDAFSVLGEWHRPRLIQQLRLPSNYIVEHIPDGGGDAVLIPKMTAREQLSIDYQGTIFLFLGILRNDKGLEVLADALQKVSLMDFRIVFAGSPMHYTAEEISAMFAFTKTESVFVHVHLDYVDEEQLPLYYAAADCLLLPYNKDYKGSTGPLMKGAGTYGLPVIVSDVSEMGNLTSLHKIGEVVAPGDSLALAKAMENFVRSSEDDRQDKSGRALQMGKQNSWGSMAKKYIDLFARLNR